MSNAKPSVGAVMLPFDNSEFFARAAESVLVNTDYRIFDLVAAHNPCSSKEMNRKITDTMQNLFIKYKNFQFIVNNENLYHGKGSMEGVRLLPDECDYVVLMNDDIFIPGNQLDWLSAMVEFMEEHPNVATLTPSLYHMKETIYWCGRKEGKGTHDFLHVPRGHASIPTEPFATSYNNFSICLIRKRLLDEIPLAQTTIHYGTDSEFCSRVKEKYPEMEHWVMPKVKLYHENIYALRENQGKDKNIEG